MANNNYEGGDPDNKPNEEGMMEDDKLMEDKEK